MLPAKHCDKGAPSSPPPGDMAVVAAAAVAVTLGCGSGCAVASTVSRPRAAAAGTRWRPPPRRGRPRLGGVAVEKAGAL